MIKFYFLINFNSHFLKVSISYQASIDSRLIVGGGINQNGNQNNHSLSGNIVDQSENLNGVVLVPQSRFSLSGSSNWISNTGSGSINDNSGNQANLNINQLQPNPPIYFAN